MKSGLFSRVSLRGFTLIELSMSLFIMAVMMAVLLSQYPETTIRLNLINVSHTASLLLREAQVRGSAVDSGNLTLVSESPVGGYGIYVSRDTPSKLTLFADTVDSTIPKPYGLAIGNGLYETGEATYPSGSNRINACENTGNRPPFCDGGINETSSITTLPNNYNVAKICIWSSNAFVCNDDYTPDIETLTVSFIRPNPQPYIYVNGATTTNFSAGCIELRSKRAPLTGHVRAVYIYNSGMIRTETRKCDNSSS